MGAANVSLRQLLTGESLVLIEEKKKGKSGYKDSGTLTPTKAQVRIPIHDSITSMLRHILVEWTGGFRF